MMRGNPTLFGVCGILLAGLLVACGGDSADTATPPASPTADAASGQTPAAADPTDTPADAATQAVEGLFSEPRARDADRTVAAPSVPSSPYEAPNGDAVLYDTLLGETIRLGPGQTGDFSPDSRYYAWVEGVFGPEGGNGPLKVLDLKGGQVLFIAEGRNPFFPDATHVAIAQPSDPGTGFLANVENGERSTQPFDEAWTAYEAWSTAPATTTSDGYRVERSAPDAPFVVVDTRTGDALLQFDAYSAAPAGAGTFVVAAEPVDGISNLFLVPIATGAAEFIGSAHIAEFNFPVVANDDVVAWVDDFCGQPNGGALYLLHRATGELVAVENPGGHWGYLHMTPGGLIGIGDFGASLLLDPEALEYTVVLPVGADITWSPDYRFAAFGWAGGHGGLC